MYTHNLQLGDLFHIFVFFYVSFPFLFFLQVVRLFGSFINKVDYTTL